MDACLFGRAGRLVLRAGLGRVGKMFFMDCESGSGASLGAQDTSGGLGCAAQAVWTWAVVGCPCRCWHGLSDLGAVGRVLIMAGRLRRFGDDGYRAVCVHVRVLAQRSGAFVIMC